MITIFLTGSKKVNTYEYILLHGSSKMCFVSNKITTQHWKRTIPDERMQRWVGVVVFVVALLPFLLPLLFIIIAVVVVAVIIVVVVLLILVHRYYGVPTMLSVLQIVLWKITRLAKYAHIEKLPFKWAVGELRH